MCSLSDYQGYLLRGNTVFLPFCIRFLDLPSPVLYYLSSSYIFFRFLFFSPPSSPVWHMGCMRGASSWRSTKKLFESRVEHIFSTPLHPFLYEMSCNHNLGLGCRTILGNTCIIQSYTHILYSPHSENGSPSRWHILGLPQRPEGEFGSCGSTYPPSTKRNTSQYWYL